MKNMKKFSMRIACVVLAVLFCVAPMSVSAASGVTVGDHEAQQDTLSFFEILPSLCPHEALGEWTVERMPTAETAGLAVQYCADCKTTVMNEKEIPSLTISAASLSLTDSLAIKYKVARSVLDCGYYSDPSVTFVMDNRTTVVSDYTVSGDYYVFVFDHIAPHLMAETIEATLTATCEGAPCAGQTKSYSVATYCYNTLGTYASDEYAALRTLLVDLLNYGAQSQIYSKHKTDTLANARLTAEQAAWGTATDRTLNTVKDTAYVVRENATVAWTSVGLSLRESVAIRYKINATNVEGLSAKVVSAGGIHVIPATEFVETAGGYYIYFDWMTSAQMSDSVYITVYDGDTAVSNTICYSVESYAYSKQSDADSDLVNLVRAMMRYGDAAKAYVNQGVTVPPEGGWTHPY